MVFCSRAVHGLAAGLSHGGNRPRTSAPARPRRASSGVGARSSVTGDRLRTVGCKAVMVIRTIALWNREGEVRRIDLSSGFNVITGESQTGKSTLIEIINYCLGRDEPESLPGPILRRSPTSAS